MTTATLKRTRRRYRRDTGHTPTTTAKPKKSGMAEYIILAHVAGILVGIGFESGKLQAIVVAVFRILVGGTA